MSPAEAARAMRSRAALAPVPDVPDHVRQPRPARRRTTGLRLVPGGLPAGTPVRVLGWVLLSLVLASVFGVVAFQALLVQSQYRLDEVQDQIAVQEERTEILRLQVTELRSPERIASEATERLGLVEPPEIVYLQHDAGDDAAAAFDPAAPVPTSTIAPTSGLGQPDPSETPASTEAADPATSPATTVAPGPDSGAGG